MVLGGFILSGQFDDPEHWLKLAADARAVAVTVNDLFAKRELLLIAQHYEGLAERAARRREEGDRDEKSA